MGASKSPLGCFPKLKLDLTDLLYTVWYFCSSSIATRFSLTHGDFNAEITVVHVYGGVVFFLHKLKTSLKHSFVSPRSWLSMQSISTVVNCNCIAKFFHDTTFAATSFISSLSDGSICNAGSFSVGHL